MTPPPNPWQRQSLSCSQDGHSIVACISAPQRKISANGERDLFRMIYSELSPGSLYSCVCPPLESRQLREDNLPLVNFLTLGLFSLFSWSPLAISKRQFLLRNKIPFTLIWKKKKKLISLFLSFIIFLIVFFAPSVARTVYGFLGSLFRLLCSRRMVVFKLPLNPSDGKSYHSSASIPLGHPVLSQSMCPELWFLSDWLLSE